MTDDNDGRVTLSRRKLLAAAGVSGVALGLGGLGTMAQFTDEEEATMAFQAGGIDGTLSYGATYNSSGDTLDEDEVVALETEQQNGGEPIVTLELPDIKPGDYGSVTFGIEVQNNPAWVASCLHVDENIDHVDYEPEVDADDDVDSANVGPDGSGGFELQGSHSTDPGELADNLFLVPFYTKDPTDSGDHPLEATFFDAGWPNYDYNPDIDYGGQLNASDLSPSSIATNAGFWNSREGGNNFGDIYPLTVASASSQAIEPSTIGWGDDSIATEHVAPDAVVEGIGEGCVFVDGDVANPDQEDGEEAGALQPGDTVYFGYDWHVPFGVGNEIQGDKLVLDFGFTFSQIRHTESAALSNIFEPGENTSTDQD